MSEDKGNCFRVSNHALSKPAPSVRLDSGEICCLSHNLSMSYKEPIGKYITQPCVMTDHMLFQLDSNQGHPLPANSL